jgi:hypothetical protein
MRRWGVLLVAIAATVLAGALASSARAWHESAVQQYWAGSLTTDGQKTRDARCGWGVDADEVLWTTGAGAYGTAAIINTSGTWVASQRNQSGHIYISIAPDLSYLRALCRNSTPWQISVYFECYMRERKYDGNIQCV